MRPEKTRQDWERSVSLDQKAKSIYRSSRDILETEAARLTRKGDLSGGERGVFHAGLVACALGADTAAEALPFARQLARETGEPGWVLAHAALEADSAVFLEAIIELGLLDPATERVWSGYKDQDGGFVRNHVCAEAAVDWGSDRCLQALLERVPDDGLLAKAVEARHPSVFETLLERAKAKGEAASINQAFARLCSRPNHSFSVDLLSAQDMGPRLIEAGASLSFDGGHPEGWASWNGSSPDKIERAWAPALRLAESEGDLPATGSLSGEMDGSVFFSHWSSACLLARSAIEGGANEAGERFLSALPGWELAKAPGSILTPLALVAMTDPATTDSRLRRTTLNTAQMILSSPALDDALRESGPLSLARAAIGKWLWGARASAPAAGERLPWRADGMAPDPLVQGLAERSISLGIRPLGTNGALAASQEFVARMRIFGDSAYQVPYARSGEGAQQKAERLAEEERRFDEFIKQEALAARQLAALMPEASAARFLSTVDAAHEKRKIPDATERSVQKESWILGLISAEPGSGSRPRL